MLTFNSLEELVHTLDQQEINEWVYTNLERFRQDPVNNDFYIIPEEDLWELEGAGQTVKNHRDEDIPAAWPDHKVQAWLEAATVQDVLHVLRRRGSEPDLPLIAKALQFYHEQDAFME